MLIGELRGKLETDYVDVDKENTQNVNYSFVKFIGHIYL